jgi:hypothetical protein
VTAGPSAAAVAGRSRLPLRGIRKPRLRAASLVLVQLATAAVLAAPGSSPALATARVGNHGALTYRYLTDNSDGRLTRSFGYNLVDLGPYRSLINSLPAGQRALVWIGNYDLATCSFQTSDATIRRDLAPLARDRKVAGYYLADEPDDGLPAYGGHCPHVLAQIEARNRLVHRLAPGAFTYEVVTEPGNFAAFAKATDVLGADPYPCLHGRTCDWRMIPRYIAALSAAHVARYWGVLQAFSDGHWRYPTAAELQAMIRQWERSRWQGEQTFAWSFDGNSLTRRPRLLAVLRALNEDISASSVPHPVSSVVPLRKMQDGGCHREQ